MDEKVTGPDLSKGDQSPQGRFVSMEQGEKSAEVDACRVVMLSCADYVADQPACDWLPSPQGIAAVAAAIRSGQILLDSSKADIERAERDRSRHYELAGTIDDDAAVVPEWLGSLELEP